MGAFSLNENIYVMSNGHLAEKKKKSLSAQHKHSYISQAKKNVNDQ
jgi:hypothetical protein